MIELALALSLLTQSAPVQSSLDVQAWFRTHLKDAQSAKIEQIKPPAQGRWKTGMGGILTVSVLSRREEHLVVFHCYIVRRDDAQAVRYLLVEGSDGRVITSKTSGRALEQHCG